MNTTTAQQSGPSDAAIALLEIVSSGVKVGVSDTVLLSAIDSAFARLLARQLQAAGGEGEAAVGGDWTDAQCLEFASVAFRHAPKNLPVGVTLQDIRMGASLAIKVTPAVPVVGANNFEDWFKEAHYAENGYVSSGDQTYFDQMRGHRYWARRGYIAGLEWSDRQAPAAPAGGFVVVPDGWVFKREGVEAFVSGPNGGGWFERKGTLWQRTLFDLVDALASPTAQPSAKDGVRGGHQYVRDEDAGAHETCQRCDNTRVMFSDNHDEAECTHCATTASGLVDGEFLALLNKHRRHVELSPGVGSDAQTYALSVIDDIRNDMGFANTVSEDRAALVRLKAVMGPVVPKCCQGCEWEWGEALRIIDAALQSVWPGEKGEDVRNSQLCPTHGYRYMPACDACAADMDRMEQEGPDEATQPPAGTAQGRA